MPQVSAPPPPAVILSVAMMLVGIVLIGVALADRDDGDELAVAVTQPSAIAAGVAPGTTAPLEGGVGEGLAPERLGRQALRGFGEVQATIVDPQGGICEVCLLSATTRDQQARGLMEVTDPELGGYDGMLFEYDAEAALSFWMRNTPLPLSIAYFDRVGEFVSATDMVPCEDDPNCPRYPAEAPARFALEVSQGELAELGVADGATIRITGRTCARAAGT